MIVSPMLNYDPKKDIINPKRCQICVQRLEEKKSDVIFPNTNYEDALDVMRLDSLEMRREKLCLKFAKACLKNEKLSDMFPRNKKDHAMHKRHNEKFVIRKARTERLQRSAIMHMQRILNNEDLEKRRIISENNNVIMPVNYDCY